MARDHKKLRVFHDAHVLTLAIYKHTKNFPKDEWFGIRIQMRRAAISVPSNIVEGSARRTTADYLKFLYIALGSASELSYLAALSSELGFIAPAASQLLIAHSQGVVRQLQRLADSLECLLAAERRDNKRRNRRRGVGSPTRRVAQAMRAAQSG